MMETDKESLQDVVDVKTVSKRSKRESIRSWLRVSLEIPVFLIFFGLYLSSVVCKSEILRLTCEIVYGLDGGNCSLPGAEGVSQETKAIEQMIQPYSANILTVKTVTESVLSGVTGLFLGSWSDRIGRKPVILAASIGFCITHGILTIFSYLYIHPWAYAFVVLPTGILGGVCSLLGVSYCYIVDISTSEQRPWRLAFLSGALAVGVFAGTVCSGVLYAATSASMVFALSTLILILAFCYAAWILHESLSQDELEQKYKFRGLLQFVVLVDMWKTFTKPREHYARYVICTCVISLSVFIITQEGSGDVMYLLTRQQFLWSTTDYTAFYAVSVVVSVVGGGLGIYVFQKVLKLPMTIICLIGIGFSAIDYFIKAFAEKSWILYLALVITVVKASYTPIARAILSNVVPKTEIGKIYAMTSAIEFLVPVGSSPLYTLIYSSTLDYFPGAFNLISAGFYLMCFALFLIVFVLEQRGLAVVKLKDES